jgi:hypothetical protein
VYLGEQAMCMHGDQTGGHSGQWGGRKKNDLVQVRLTVPSLLAGTPSRSTVRRISSRPPSTSPCCGPRCRRRSRCVIVGSNEQPLMGRCGQVCESDPSKVLHASLTRWKLRWRGKSASALMAFWLKHRVDLISSPAVHHKTV